MLNITSNTTINKNSIENFKVSIVIPTRNNENELKLCLNTIKEQTRKPDQVIIISESDSKENLSSNNPNLPLQYIHSNKRIGPSALRNIGIQQCTGDIIVFLDDDSIPSLDFIENITQSFSNVSIGIIRGKVNATNSISKHLAHHYDLGNAIKEISPRLLLLCCMAVRKHILDKLHGFDEDIPYGHEEADLGYRAEYHGIKSFYIPNVIVFHNYSNSIGHYLKKRFKWGQKRHQLKKHNVRMIGRKRIILNLFPPLSFALLAIFYQIRSTTLLFVWFLFVLSPFFFWFIRGLIEFRNPVIAFVYGLGEISGDIGYISGIF